MAKTRAKLFADDDGQDSGASNSDTSDSGALDLDAFKPKTAPGRDAPPPDQVRAVSEAAEFRSREAARPAQPAQTTPGESRNSRRTHRTGRNVQFNVKASQDVVDTFYRVSDRQGWVLGETLERALAALERDLADRP